MPRKKKEVAEPQLAPPDWHSAHLTDTSRYPEGIPDPWIYRWPNDKGVRRTVSVDISSWRGLSLGASHYYASVEEEANQIWDGKELTWFTCDNHPTMKKRHFKADVFTRPQAVQFIAIVLAHFFSSDTEFKIHEKYRESGTKEQIIRRLSKGT